MTAARPAPAPAQAPAAVRGTRPTQALHAEWTKLRTTPGVGWLLLTALVLTVGVSVLTSASAHYSPGAAPDLAKIAFAGVIAGQGVLAALGVLVVSGEYSTGLIRTTLTASPRRLRVLAAKGGLVAALAFVVGAVAVLGCLLAGRALLPGDGFTAAHGFASLSLTDGPVLRAAFGSVLYLTLVALLGLGVATAVRDTATAVGGVLVLLYVFPIVTSVVTNPQWQRRLEQISPMNAGLRIQATTDLSGQPLSPWAGLGVLGLWAAAALVVGGLVLRLRDA